MKTYKAPDGSLHCIHPQYFSWLPFGSIEVTEQEAEIIRQELQQKEFSKFEALKQANENK